MEAKTKDTIKKGVIGSVALFFGWSYYQFKAGQKNFPHDCRWEVQPVWHPFTADFPFFSAIRQRQGSEKGISNSHCPGLTVFDKAQIGNVAGTNQYAVKKSLPKV
jgi:hypothetical protein